MSGNAPVVKMCPHVRMDSDIPAVGLLNYDGSANWSCNSCTVDRWRRVVSFKSPEDILADINLDNADIPDLLREMLIVVQSLVTGAKAIKKFDAMKPRPVKWQNVRETRTR